MSYEFFCNKLGCGGEITYGSLAIGIIGLLIIGFSIYYIVGFIKRKNII